jgi:hypothetical protein
MTETEFHNLLDRFGADLAQWPVDRRQQAEQAMARDPSLAGLLAADRLLAGILDDLPPVMASPTLRQQVMGLPLAHPRPVSRSGLLAGIWQGMTGSWRQWSMGMGTACAAALLGFVLGYGQLLPPPASGTQMAGSDDLVAMLDMTADYDTADAEQVQ